MKTKKKAKKKASKKARKPKPKALRSLDDLKECPWNPREISPKALNGLKESIARLGDISGIVWNRRSGHLVCGHARLRAMREEHGDGVELKVDGDEAWVVLPDGERFRVRIVDWDEPVERLANVTANNPHITGEFTEDVAAIMDQIAADDADLFDRIGLGDLQVDLDALLKVPAGAGGKELGEDIGGEARKVKCPDCGCEFET